MTSSISLWLAGLIVLAANLGGLRPPISAAGVPPNVALVPLHNGINQVDLGTKVIAGMVVLAHRENFNAHSFEVATFYLRTRELESDPAQWQIIPFQIRTDSGRMQNDLQVSGGADCQVHTFRLLRGCPDKSVCIVTADRAPGLSFADPGPVTFTWFKLNWSQEGGAGDPTAWFAAYRSETTKKLYCDVDEALVSELHVGGAIMPKN